MNADQDSGETSNRAIEEVASSYEIKPATNLHRNIIWFVAVLAAIEFDLSRIMRLMKKKRE